MFDAFFEFTVRLDWGHVLNCLHKAMTRHIHTIGFLFAIATASGCAVDTTDFALTRAAQRSDLSMIVAGEDVPASVVEVEYAGTVYSQSSPDATGDLVMFAALRSHTVPQKAPISSLSWSLPLTALRSDASVRLLFGEGAFAYVELTHVADGTSHLLDPERISGTIDVRIIDQRAVGTYHMRVEPAASATHAVTLHGSFMLPIEGSLR